jgi:hypothetical protein
MAPHSKGKGVKHLITEDKASIIAYKDAGSASSEIAAQIGHNQESSGRCEGPPCEGYPALEKKALTGRKTHRRTAQSSKHLRSTSRC